MNKIKFENYPIHSNDVNVYVKKFKLCMTLYNAMLNCFENSVIEGVLHENFKILVEKLDKFFCGGKEGNKTENENIFKQYFILFFYFTLGLRRI